MNASCTFRQGDRSGFLTSLLPGRLLGVISAAFLAAGAPAQPTSPPAIEDHRPTYDAETGRNLLNYPPHRSATVEHIRLAITIPDMNRREMACEETIRFRPIAGDLETLSLNGALLDIGSAESSGRTVSVKTLEDSEQVEFTLHPPVPRGQTCEMTVRYRVVDPPEGILWTCESPAHPGRAAQLHSQGQPESNRYWFLCNDFPSSRQTSELIVTVPRGYRAISNGVPAPMTPAAASETETYHWRLDRPHPAYLISLIVGRFDTADVGTASLPMPVFVPPGQRDRVQPTFGRTPRMIELFSRIADEPYPWPMYAQTAVLNFAWSGMENTSATTLMGTVALDSTALKEEDQDELIAHELAHQWFGDLITCRSWEHVWLNEGFATFCEALWAEYRDSAIPRTGRGVAGLQSDDAAYQWNIWSQFEEVIRQDHADAPRQSAMASKQYHHPDDVFDREANPYPKGASVLHMLRRRLGDDVFFRAVAAYVDRCKDRSVETYEFREVMERVSGESLQRFFDQWVLRPGVPEISTAPTWDSGAGVLNLAFAQTQPIDGYNPAFDLRIPVWVRCAGDKAWRTSLASFDTRAFTLTVPLPSEPEMVVIDPGLNGLADYRITQPRPLWLRQLADGPTPASRLQAAQQLGRSADPSAEVVEALERTVANSRAHVGLRKTAAIALTCLARPALAPLSGDEEPESGESAEHHADTPPIAAPAAALRRLADADIADPRVRAAVLVQVGRAFATGSAEERRDLAATMTGIFGHDASYAVRAAAVEAIGLLDAQGEAATVVLAAATPSQHDQIRVAALGAAARLDTDEMFQLAAQMTEAGQSPETRAAAATAIGVLAHHQPKQAFTLLALLVNDREPRTSLAAGEAISTLGTIQARTFLLKRLSETRGRWWTAKTAQWLENCR